jgi:hypothetical protein
MSDSNDVSGGSDSEGGNDVNDGRNLMTNELAQQLARGAKTQGVGPARPWDKCDPNAKPEHRFTFRLNDYDRAIAHFVAGMRGTSVQQALVLLLRQAALRDIAKKEKG